MTNDLAKNKSDQINTNFGEASKQEEDKYSVTLDGPIMPTKKK